jgi:uncharacterized protein
MRIGTVKQIWRFAVKSMAGERLESCTIGTRGIPGDRGWAIRDETAGKLATGSRFPLLMQCAASYRESPVNGVVPHVDMQFPDGFSLGSDGGDVNERLSELLGKPVSLSSLAADANAEHYFDVAPIHVLTTASLAEMSRLNPAAIWDVRRFRPNFFVETEPGIEGLIEFEWTGKQLRLGEVELYCEIPCERCAMASNAQRELPKDASVLRSIVKEANTNLGMYAKVTTPGEVKVGDIVELI